MIRQKACSECGQAFEPDYTDQTICTLCREEATETRRTLCENCNGTGEVSDKEYMDGDPYVCDECNGTGKKEAC